MDDWKRSFIGKLEHVRKCWVAEFDEALQATVVPVFEELGEFLHDHGFRTSMPLHEDVRCSFKFELTENAYLLMIFRFTDVGSFELLSEAYVPGHDPQAQKTLARLADLDRPWAQKRIQGALDAFVERLAGSREAAKELAAV